VQKVNLSSFNNDWYNPGAGIGKRLLWHICSLVYFESKLWLPYSLKRFLLRMFGASVGKGVVIKPSVQIKYPWKLSIGDYAWIGEHVWIDNLDQVTIGDHACISQGAMFLTGNHDYSKSSFDLIVKPITVEEGAWIGAKATVTQGVVIGSHSLLTVGSIASKDLPRYSICKGNPAEKIKERVVE
jgi:putative colanic acid biosynthesis acetyltransferase WcaF